MTLDITKFIENSVRTQSKIHHLDINVKAVKTDDIPKSVTSLIYKDYGEKYLNDADYVTFFWGGINKDNIDKLFNTVDKALGKSANKLTDKDFKKIHMDDSNEPSETEPEEENIEDNEPEEDIDIETTEETFDDVDEKKPEEGENSEKTEEEPNEETSDEEEPNEETSSDEEETETDGKNELNEDDEEKIDIEVEDQPIPTAYFFLKITTK